jgi:hypothetical protein
MPQHRGTCNNDKDNSNNQSNNISNNSRNNHSGQSNNKTSNMYSGTGNDQVPCMIFSIASQTIASSNAHHNIGIVREIEVLRTCRDASVSVDTNMAAQGAPLHNVNATPHLSDDNPAMHWTTQQRQWQ